MTKLREMNLLILGAGSHGIDIHEIAKSLHVFNKIFFGDDDPSWENVIGKWKDAENYLGIYPLAIVAVGDEDTRRMWIKKYKLLALLFP